MVLFFKGLNYYQNVTGRVACKQMMPKDEEQSIEGERKREKEGSN